MGQLLNAKGLIFRRSFVNSILLISELLSFWSNLTPTPKSREIFREIKSEDAKSDEDL